MDEKTNTLNESACIPTFLPELHAFNPALVMFHLARKIDN
jgi:hypothetical protein